MQGEYRLGNQIKCKKTGLVLNLNNYNHFLINMRIHLLLDSYEKYIYTLILLIIISLSRLFLSKTLDTFSIKV